MLSFMPKCLLIVVVLGALSSAPVSEDQIDGGYPCTGCLEQFTCPYYPLNQNSLECRRSALREVACTIQKDKNPVVNDNCGNYQYDDSNGGAGMVQCPVEPMYFDQLDHEDNPCRVVILQP
jgi:hypothetical protein